MSAIVLSLSMSDINRTFQRTLFDGYGFKRYMFSFMTLFSSYSLHGDIGQDKLTLSIL